MSRTQPISLNRVTLKYPSLAMSLTRNNTTRIFDHKLEHQRSNTGTRLVDPRGTCPMSRLVPASRSKAGRGGLGRIVGLMDISKPGGSWFLDRVEKLLLSRGEASEVRRYAKPTFAKPCPDKLRKQIASECDAVILALAD